MRRASSTFILSLLVSLLAATLTAGCAAVSPWERDILSRRAMSFTDETEEAILDHTFYSAREGGAGGFESGGGGCGCN